jgi:hypothetical protein
VLLELERADSQSWKVNVVSPRSWPARSVLQQHHERGHNLSRKLREPLTAPWRYQDTVKMGDYFARMPQRIHPSVEAFWAHMVSLRPSCDLQVVAIDAKQERGRNCVRQGCTTALGRTPRPPQDVARVNPTVEPFIVGVMRASEQSLHEVNGTLDVWFTDRRPNRSMDSRRQDIAAECLTTEVPLDEATQRALFSLLHSVHRYVLLIVRNRRSWEYEIFCAPFGTSGNIGDRERGQNARRTIIL